MNANTLHGDFVLLRAGKLRLLLPQQEVGAAEYLEARPQSLPDEPLLLAGDASGRLFAALSDDMVLLRDCPPQRFVVTTLGDDDLHIGWCWDEMKVLIGVALEPRELPAVLVTPGTPVDAYVLHEGQIAYLSSAARVTAFALGEGVPA